MTKILNKDIINSLSEKGNVKMLATVNDKGVPHLVVKDSIVCDEAGRLMYLELLESSRTNKNMIYSLWFEKMVSINILTKEGKSIQIKGIPRKTLIAGPIFERYYNLVQKQCESADLAAIYYIDIKEIINETFDERKEEESIKHPLYMHIDRLSK